jgi:hypothetical protein
MIIANYQVQSTLRAYGQQLADRSRLSKIKAPKNLPAKDQVVLSPEGKKRLMAEKIAAQIVGQMHDGSQSNDTAREILKALGREYGLPVQVEKKDGRGLVFKVSDSNSPDGTRTLSPEENDNLNKKVFEVAQSIVYNNLT